MEAIVYPRFSTMEQGREGDSITRQLNACQPFCEQKGWDHEVMVDRGKSAFKADHRAGGALGSFEREAAAGSHVGKVIVVESLDRLSREDHTETYDLIRAFQRAGVSVATVEGDRLYEAYGSISFEEVIELIVRARMNHEASLQKRRHGKSKWEARRKAAAGKAVITTLCPAWLEALPDRSGFRIIGDGDGFQTDRGAIVRAIYEWADEGLGAVRIVRKLTDAKVPVWTRFANREAKVWQRTFITRILRDPTVIGDYQPMAYADDGRRRPAGEPIRGYYPRVIEPDVFARVSGAAADRKAVRGNRSSVIANLVAGLAICHQCGARMIYRQARPMGHVRVKNGVEQSPLPRAASSLVCPTGEAHGCANRKHSPYATLEKALVSDALHLAMDDRAFARRDEIAKLDIQIADRKRDHDIAFAAARELWESAGSSAIARSLAGQREGEAEALAAEVEELQALRVRASGAADAAQHLSRLDEIRGNLLHPDLNIRAGHRQKVAQGFRAVIDKIVCHPGRYDVHFKGDVRFMQIWTSRGRRDPVIANLNLDHPTRDHSSDAPAVANMRKRARADRNPNVFP